MSANKTIKALRDECDGLYAEVRRLQGLCGEKPTYHQMLREARALQKERSLGIERLPVEPSASAVSIPDGYCLMPRRLTAENGAKALLLGEFKLEVTHECPECLELEEPAEGCEICDGQGEYAQHHTIPWDQIKFIYSEAVKGLALRAQPAVAEQFKLEVKP